MSAKAVAERPVWGWRLLAWYMLLSIGLMSLPKLPFMDVTGWMLAASNYVAIVGLLSYAYGRRARPLWFWRVFALLFSFYTMASLGPLLRAFTSALWAAPEQLNGRDWTLSLGPIVVCFLVCVGLLRHAELLRGRQRSAGRALEQVFA
jgi:hypothetical protein